MERLVKRAVGGLDAQRGIQNQQRLAHRVDNVLGVILNIVDNRSSFHYGHPFACFEITSRDRKHHQSDDQTK
jgi:hypothetical protein